jgi:hypothetical protein
LLLARRASITPTRYDPSEPATTAPAAEPAATKPAAAAKTKRSANAKKAAAANSAPAAPKPATTAGGKRNASASAEGGHSASEFKKLKSSITELTRALSNSKTNPPSSATEVASALAIQKQLHDRERADTLRERADTLAHQKQLHERELADTLAKTDAAALAAATASAASLGSATAAAAAAELLAATAAVNAQTAADLAQGLEQERTRTAIANADVLKNSFTTELREASNRDMQREHALRKHDFQTLLVHSKERTASLEILMQPMTTLLASKNFTGNDRPSAAAPTVPTTRVDNLNLMDQVLQMNVQDLLQFLRDQGCDKHTIGHAQSAAIDGEIFVHMTEPDIKDFFPNSNNLQQAKLWRLIAKLNRA